MVRMNDERLPTRSKKGRGVIQEERKGRQQEQYKTTTKVAVLRSDECSASLLQKGNDRKNSEKLAAFKSKQCWIIISKAPTERVAR